MRKTRLVECDPQWVENYHGTGKIDAVRFNCPEGHVDCIHVIPFTPALDGSANVRDRVQWQRAGDDFETLTLAPSIKRNPRYASREEAIAAGCLSEYVNDSMLCAFHGFVTNGQITFCGDSK